MDPWKPWQPSAKEPWNVRRVVHLHRRAGFAGTWEEIQRDLKSEPHTAVERVLNGEACPSGVPDDFDSMAQVIGDAAVASGNVNRLKAWWHYRMLFSPDPLTERLTLMWHNHFATSNSKVQDLAAMRRQNEIFREFARAPFGELLSRVVKDPAMLVWLDAQANRKEHPNENLARELMELFTLGVGHYTETDVKEAARTLTGWTVSGDRSFREAAEQHDDGEKTILDRTGRWRGDDLIRILLEQPATSERLAARVCELLMGERATDREAIQSLAVGLRSHDLDIGWAVETVLRSAAFFSDANIGNRVRGPVEFVIGSVRTLELYDPPPSTLVLAEWTASLGQDLFYPPNVFGWPGGRSWLTSRAVIARANFASALVAGALGGRDTAFEPQELLERHGREDELDAAISFFSDLILGGAVPESMRKQLRTVPASSSGAGSTAARGIVSLLLASPEAQLS